MGVYLWAEWQKTINIDWTSLSELPSDYVSRWSYTFSWWLTFSWTLTGQIWIPLDMSNLHKVTIECTWDRTAVSQAWWNYIGITDWTSWTWNWNRYKAIYWQKWYGTDASVSANNGIGHTEAYSTSTQLTSFTTGTNQGNFDLKLEIDLTDWSVVFSSTAPYTYSYTADASAYLTEMKTYWYVYLALYVNWTTCTFYNTTITYE